MTAALMPADAIVLDAAGFHAVTDFGPFARSGARGVSLYLVGKFAVSAATVHAAWDAGLTVQLNWERTPDAYLGGATSGHAAVAEALPVAERMGWGHESPIVFSATDTGVTDTAKADAWYRAMVDDMLAANAVGGAYGPAAYLRHLAAQPWWPDDFVLWHWAGDGAKPESWTWAQQLLAQQIIAGVTVDQSRICKPYPFWAATALPPQEIDMLPEESKMLADLHALLGAAAVNPDGSPVWQDPFGNPMPMPWNLGWVWEYVRHIRDDLTPDAIANAVVAKLPASSVTLDEIEAVFKQVMNEITLTINFETP